MLNRLIKLADRFDGTGNVKLADKIDRFIQLCIKRYGRWEDMDESNLPSHLQEAIQRIDEGYLEGDEEQERTMPMLGDSEFKYEPEYYQQTVRPESLEKARKEKSKRKIEKDLGESLDAAIESLEKEEFLPEEERSEEAKERAIPTLGPKDFKYEPKWYKGEVKRRREKQREMDRMSENVTTKLVSLADKFDREGKFELADAVDSVITSKAARPKAPLKGLNDDVKKSLILFVIDADKNMKSSTKGLGELFRRMRYFDIADSIKELGLDKVVKDMEKTQECLDGAKKNFYAMTFGKHPSKADIEKLIKELGKEGDGDDEGQAALDFFSKHTDDDIPKMPEFDSEEAAPDEEGEEGDTFSNVFENGVKEEDPEFEPDDEELSDEEWDEFINDADLEFSEKPDDGEEDPDSFEDDEEI